MIHRSISSAEDEEKPAPRLGDYIRGTVSEADPKAVSEKPIISHEGVVTKDKGKTWEVVNTGPAVDYYGHEMKPKYTIKEVHKEGAAVLPVPHDKKPHVDQMRKLIQSNQ